MKNIGFTGTSRVPLTITQRETLRVELMRLGPSVLHIGDAINADAECFDIASGLMEPCSERKSFGIIGHPPTNRSKRAFKPYDIELDPKPYVERDDGIIKSSDYIIACPRLNFREELRSGT